MESEIESEQRADPQSGRVCAGGLASGLRGDVRSASVVSVAGKIQWVMAGNLCVCGCCRSIDNAFEWG